MLPPQKNLNDALRARGLTRRQLVKFCSAMLATLALPYRYLSRAVAAVSQAKKPLRVWLQSHDCTGCSEPRGSLGHWVEIKGRSIKNYQAMVPMTWNAGPRGAYEAALLNTRVADPGRPLEILRTVHPFDPCIACAVHVIDAQGRKYTIPRVA